MTWKMVAGGSRSLRLAADLGIEAIDDIAGADRLVHTGDDASLARLADVAGPEVPILHAPFEDSDVARLFGAADTRQRMDQGAPYPVDLLVARSGELREVAVAHIVASASGRLPGVLAARRLLSIARDGRAALALRGTAILLANAQHLGSRTVAPKAALMDGRFDVQVMTGGPIERLRTLRAMERGVHLRRRSVHRRQASRIEFSLPRGWRLACDGRSVPGRSWVVVLAPAAGTLWV